MIRMQYCAGVSCSFCIYANDVVLLHGYTATATRHLLICDNFATDFDVIFNTQKSKCIFFEVQLVILVVSLIVQLAGAYTSGDKGWSSQSFDWGDRVSYIPNV